MNQAWNSYAFGLRTGFGEINLTAVSVALADFDDEVRLRLDRQPHHVLDLGADAKRLLELFREQKLEILQIGLDPAVTRIASRLAMEVVAQHMQRMEAMTQDLHALIASQILRIGLVEIGLGLAVAGLAVATAGAATYALWNASVDAQIALDPEGDYDGDGKRNKDDKHPRDPDKGFFTKWWQELDQIAAFAPLTRPQVRAELPAIELALTAYLGASGVRLLELQAPRVKPVLIVLRT